jgi:tetratricopeptide (TPR) repeat protein
MSKPAQRAEELFAGAMKIADGEARRAYLDQACGGDAALRREVESLLAAHFAAGDFLGQTVVLPQRELVTEKPGTRIGRYKLLEKIGEGGFGVVWMAEQEEPVRRRVALKIIKLGMDTKEVVARFEAERQALAMMDHPNIASVFDGGATDAGRPYFVMELVKGVPITEYCDVNKLFTSERLGLFMQVCHAVQHAHQKGVVHRDLKPSNILVTVKDDQPVPKVIDFGVAKATQMPLTDKTMFTRLNLCIGTPTYMSPEQAGLGSLDVDTRSDIYSLGVLLYELLTGRTPFDTEKILAAGYDAVMRFIREEEPPKPSTRLSTLKPEELTAVAAKRHAEPAKLERGMRGDLDWIVMKALEKDRRRRYETPDAFASDVARHLNSEPVTAAAPSALYTLQKFIHRHKAGLAVGASLLLLLLAGAAVSTWQAVRATRAERVQSVLRQQAEAARANERQLRLQAEAREKIAQADAFVRSGSPEEADKAMRTISSLLDDMNAPGAAAIYLSLGDWRARQGQWQEAATNYFKSLAGRPDDFEASHWLAPVLMQTGDGQSYEQLRRRTLARFGETTDPVIAERIVTDCLILPWSGPELERLGKIADTALSAGSNHWAWNSIQFAKGLAEYRSGHFAGAVDWLQAPLREQGRDLARDVEAYMVLAMAQHRLGYPGYARDALTTGLGLDARLPSSDNDLKDWKAWNDWVIAQTLMREAKDLVNGPTNR